MAGAKREAAADVAQTEVHVKSIIEPPLVDHVRREALKFENELKRAV